MNSPTVNFERLDDAVRARKALNGRDVLGSDVGAIRIGFAKVPTKGNPEGPATETEVPVNVQGVGELSVGATIHALRGIKGAATIPVDQQVLSGSLENYRSNLLLSMIGSGLHTGGSTLDGAPRSGTWSPLMTEQQMIMRELSGGSLDAEADIAALAGKVFMRIDYHCTSLNHLSRIPSPNHVLHHDPISFRATPQQKVGCFEVERAQKEDGHQHYLY